MKLKQLYIINENLQQADKIYFKTNKLSPKVREIMISSKMTGGDALTKIVCDMYYARLQNDLKTGQWALNAIDKNEPYDENQTEYSTKVDYKNVSRWKEIKGYYQQLKSYNKNVFPVKEYTDLDNSSILNFMHALKSRAKILIEFEKLPSIAKRNMKNDIRTIRDSSQMNTYFNDLSYFMANFSYLDNRSGEVKNNILKKMFKSNTTLDKLLDFVEEKENLIGGGDLNRETITNIISEHEYDLSIIYEKGDIMVVEVTDVEGMTALGCNSLWCFTYGEGRNYRQWSEYSYNGIVYTIIDFSVSSDDKDFMHVVIKPIDFFADEDDEYANEDNIFSMDNNNIYGGLSFIDYAIGLKRARKMLTFGYEPQENPNKVNKPKKEKKEISNQLELNFESKLSKLFNSILSEELTYRYSNTDGPEDDEYKIGMVKEEVDISSLRFNNGKFNKSGPNTIFNGEDPIVDFGVGQLGEVTVYDKTFTNALYLQGGFNASVERKGYGTLGLAFIFSKLPKIESLILQCTDSTKPFWIKMGAKIVGQKNYSDRTTKQLYTMVIFRNDFL